MDKNQTSFNNFITELKNNIQSNYRLVAEAFGCKYNWPEVDSIRNEICKCIMCGFYQATITLTNHLLESVMKKTLIIYDSKNKKTEQNDISNIFDDATSQYAGEILSKNIDKACQYGLITELEQTTLHECRSYFRNAFSHADSRKIFQGMSIPARQVTTEDLADIGVFLQKIFVDEPNVNLSVGNNLIIQGLAQSVIAEQQACDYFLKIDNIIRQLCRRLFD